MPTRSKQKRPEQTTTAVKDKRADVRAETTGVAYGAVVGLDVGDRHVHYCMLDLAGEVIAEGVITTREQSVRMLLDGKPRMRVALEAGNHSPWISRLLTELGHEAIVANARNVRMISQSDGKNDPADARMLARLARVGPDLLGPIQHRSADVQSDLTIIRAREVAVTGRTKLINAVRGLVKSTGKRLPGFGSGTFGKKAREACPPELKEALAPLLRLIEHLTREIQLYDRMVTKKASTKYPETKTICTIPGVGPLTALAMVLMMNNDPKRFGKSRDVGCYFGLRPIQRQSGASSPQLGITKAGDHVFRRLITQSAQYILGPFGKDCALRRWGLSLAVRGGKNAKKRAVIAVARKLSILMHRLWVKQEEFDPERGLSLATAAA
jgi:transposase